MTGENSRRQESVKVEGGGGWKSSKTDPLFLMSNNRPTLFSSHAKILEIQEVGAWFGAMSY